MAALENQSQFHNLACVLAYAPSRTSRARVTLRGNNNKTIIPSTSWLICLPISTFLMSVFPYCCNLRENRLERIPEIDEQ